MVPRALENPVSDLLNLNLFAYGGGPLAALKGCGIAIGTLTHPLRTGEEEQCDLVRITACHII